VRTDGLARFAAIGILTAYAWLAVVGVMLVAWGLASSGLRYDAVLHAFFIGFVFGAIIAHEPIIAPTVTGLPFVYSPLLYLPLVALDSSLAVRLTADLLDAGELRRWAGLVQVLAILLFMMLSASSILVGWRRHHEDTASKGSSPH
jgi:hypothetical protein